MLNIYLDTSALNRIFDDQSQPRIFLEASAMLLVFGLIEKRIISIVSSDVLIYENSRNPYSERQIFVTSVLRKARVIQTLNDSLAKRAQEIEKDCCDKSGGINHAGVATGGRQC
ncbi:MAG: hypothetical protein PHW12_08845 [Smithella sp.]|nr:hypothetical protein [Smithella sp.]MDD5693636.1 PIN domain-containing protein [Patescibacteria group bacterium]